MKVEVNCLGEIRHSANRLSSCSGFDIRPSSATLRARWRFSLARGPTIASREHNYLRRDTPCLDDINIVLCDDLATYNKKSRVGASELGAAHTDTLLCCCRFRHCRFGYDERIPTLCRGACAQPNTGTLPVLRAHIPDFLSERISSTERWTPIRIVLRFRICTRPRCLLRNRTSTIPRQIFVRRNAC